MANTIPNTDVLEVAIIAAALEIAVSGNYQDAEDMTKARLERFTDAYKTIVETVLANPVKQPKHPLAA